VEEQLLLAPTRREWSGGNEETNGLRNERDREGAKACVVVVVLVEREAATANAATVNFMADDLDTIRFVLVNEEMSGDGRRDEFSLRRCSLQLLALAGAFLDPCLDGVDQ
jgi:hypothetical protein